MGFYEDLEKSLQEAIAIKEGKIPVVERENMPAQTYTAANREKELIEEIVAQRKENSISQGKLAEMTGNKQQAISRFEKGEHSPSLRTFCDIAHALGYDVRLVKV